MIKVYNTLTGKKETFVPVVDQEVRMYACGITPYDICHLGHARQAMIYDVIRQYLIYKGYNVVYARNYTDIDDKIIDRSIELGIDSLEHSHNMIEESEKDLKALGINPPDVSPKVSEHMDDIIGFIDRLIENGYAYAAENGDVYFSVDKFKSYGKLSNRNKEELLHGVRKDVGSYKRDPLDFALWKTAKPGEPHWESKWGNGRPGWHIECSAMSMKYLGKTFDIHGGGKDLIFPHHENEIAQSEAYSNQLFSKYWLHNGLITINGQKMSKSLKNFISIKDILKKYNSEVVRLCLLTFHYSSDIDLREENFEIAEKRFYTFSKTIYNVKNFLKKTEKGSSGKILNQDVIDSIEKDFENAMDNDFNTALAISNFSKIFKYLNKLLDDGKVLEEDKWETLAAVDEKLFKVFRVLGIFNNSSKEAIDTIFSKYVSKYNIDLDEVDSLVKNRAVAKNNKDYKRADEIRNILDDMGIILKDRNEGAVEIDIKDLYFRQ